MKSRRKWEEPELCASHTHTQREREREREREGHC